MARITRIPALWLPAFALRLCVKPLRGSNLRLSNPVSRKAAKSAKKTAPGLQDMVPESVTHHSGSWRPAQTRANHAWFISGPVSRLMSRVKT
jgi:hypothetical protein